MAGDSGSLVVDARTGDIYGHIVSGDPTSSLAYIIPAYKVFEDIEERFGVRPSLPDTIQQAPHRTIRNQGKLPERKAKRTSLSKASEAGKASFEENVPRGGSRWTEISKELVSADAIKDIGWKYRESKDYYYVMEYLEYVSRNTFN